MASTSPAGAVAGYGDVPADVYYTAPVQWATDSNIISEVGPCFLPDASVSRGEAALYLWRMQSSPDPSTSHSFVDVPESLDQAVSWLVDERITTGTSPTTFAPDETLTRAQLAAFLWRLADEPLPDTSHPFTDVTTPWQQQPIAWLLAEGITTGTSPTTFVPNETLTRAHVFTFLYRYNDNPRVAVDNTSPRCSPSGRFTSVVAGAAHACGIRTDGTVQCWTPSAEAEPSCEFHSEGRLICRQIDYGQFHHGQEEAPAGTFSQIAIAPQHVCGLRSDGTIFCWGNPDRRDAPAGTFTAIAISEEQNCGLRADGTVRCRDYTGHGPSLRGLTGKFTSIVGGSDDGGALGGVCGIRTDGTVDCWATLGPPADRFRRVALGSSSTCGIVIDGTVNCSHSNPVSNLASLNGSIHGGGELTCERRTDDTLTCRGNVEWTQAPTGFIPSAPGHGTCSTDGPITTCWKYVQRTNAPAGIFTSIHRGSELTCERLIDGTITCTGKYRWTDAPTGTFTFIDAGGEVMCGIRSGGTVECWGNVEQTDVPAGTFTFVAVGRATDFNDIPPACGIRSDGTVECWGNRPNYDQPDAPTGTFSSLAAGVGFMCGIRTDGTAKCWLV